MDSLAMLLQEIKQGQRRPKEKTSTINVDMSESNHKR